STAQTLSEQKLPWSDLGGWPIQAWFWLEWGSSEQDRVFLPLFRVSCRLSEPISSIPRSRVTSPTPGPLRIRSGQALHSADHRLRDDLLRSGVQSWGDLNIPTQAKTGHKWATRRILLPNNL